MRTINLTQGACALVDDEDYSELSKHKWYLDAGGYARRNVTTKPSKQGALLMHRVIMGNDGSEIDHINRDKLDNRRSNLRYADRSMNMHNTVTKNGRFRGTVKQPNGKWHAVVRLNRVAHHLGSYYSREEAARKVESFRRANCV